MRYLLILLLAGCGLNPEYREARENERIARDEQSCIKLGFKPDTEKIAECKLQLKVAREAALRQPSSPPPKTTTTCQTFGNATQCY